MDLWLQSRMLSVAAVVSVEAVSASVLVASIVASVVVALIVASVVADSIALPIAVSVVVALTVDLVTAAHRFMVGAVSVIKPNSNLDCQF